MEVIQAARCVPVRELSRSTGELIDQVERDGKTFAVSRHGRMVALVIPLPERLMLQFDGVAPPDTQQVDEPDPHELDELELSESDRDLLIDVATNLTPTGLWKTDDSSLTMGLHRLEVAGLIEFINASTRKVSPAGRRIVAALRR
ncbi:MAG: type II toxin-antitoxin system Phd/YefM family antitoxin [Actinomycetota bacterium]